MIQEDQEDLRQVEVVEDILLVADHILEIDIKEDTDQDPDQILVIEEEAEIVIEEVIDVKAALEVCQKARVIAQNQLQMIHKKKIKTKTKINLWLKIIKKAQANQEANLTVVKTVIWKKDKLMVKRKIVAHLDADDY